MKKFIALTLAVIMLASSMCLSAFAAETEATTTYNYVAFGDSIASGYGLSGDDHAFDPALILTEDLINDPVKQAYAAVFGEYLAQLGAEKGIQTTTTNLSTTAYRAEDVAETILTEGTKGEICEWILEKFVGPNASEPLLNYHNIFSEYLPDADLVTIELGANDIIMAMVFPMVQSENPVLVASAVSVALVLFGKDVTFALGAGLTLLDQYKDQITVDVIKEAAAFIKEALKSLDKFVEQSAAHVQEAVQAVKTVNDHADIVLVGMFNPFGNSLEYQGQIRDIYTVVHNIFQKAIASLIEKSQTSDTESIKALAPVSGSFTEIAEAIASKAKEAIMYVASMIADEITYPIQYLLIGRTVDPQIKYLNELLAQIAEEEGATFVDIYDISNECNLDPHPDAQGHQEIAEHLEAALAELVSDAMDAKKEAETAYVYGDVDLDGEVAIFDTTLIQRALVDMDELTPLQEELADVDADGDMSIMDATAIQRYLAGVEGEANRIGQPYVA